MNLQPAKPVVVHVGNLCILYWAAQCVLGVAAMGLGTFNPIIFLGASVIGAFPVMAYAHFLFAGQGRRAPHLKPWALRCAVIMAVQLAASAYAWYAPGKEAAILWAAATVLLAFVLHVSQRFLKKA